MTQGTTVLRIYLFIGESQTLLMYVTGVFCYCTLWVRVRFQGNMNLFALPVFIHERIGMFEYDSWMS